MVVEADLCIRYPDAASESVPEGTRLIHVSRDQGKCLTIIRADTPEALDRLRDEMADVLTEHRVLEQAETWAVVRCGCPPYGSTDKIRSLGCSVVYPIIEVGSDIHYTVVAPSRDRLRASVERLEEEEGATVDVGRVSEVHGDAIDVNVSLSSLTGQLTPRQLEALLLAVKHGYFETPRRVEAEDLAEQLGIGRSTFQEHLRKAEQALLGRFASIVGEHPALEDAATKGPGRPSK